MKKFLLLSCFLLFSFLTGVQAQTMGRVTGQVIDAEVEGLTVAGATVSLSAAATPDLKSYYSADGDGRFILPLLPYGDYKLEVSFFGYQNAQLDFKVASAEMELPQIKLSVSAQQIEAVVMEAKALRASQSGDTLNYNASAFKVTNDADVEGLLQKMPGISIEDGEVQAQGETVKKIYVDGKEFFGNDVATALKSLPAEIVDKIEVYDRLSDDAQYSGIDDGDGEKTINIVTKPNMRKGIFGKIFGGGGYEEAPRETAEELKYLGGGSVNLFHGDTRISFIGLANNLNQQNFSFEDIMGVTDDSKSSSGSFMVKPLPGVATVNAMGVNYSDTYGKKDQVQIQASYFFNQTTTENEEKLIRWYDEAAGMDYDSIEQVAYTTTRNLNNRLNAKIEFDLPGDQRLMLRPTLSFQTNDPLRYVEGERYGDKEHINYETKYDENGVQLYSNAQNAYWNGYNGGLSGNYRLGLGNGHTLTLGGGFSLNNNEYDNEYVNYPNYPVAGSIVDFRYEDSPTRRFNYNASLGYSKNLAKNWIFNTNYRISQNSQDNNKKAYLTDENYQFSDGDLNDAASSETKSVYTTHRAGPSLRYYKGKSNIVANVNYQYSILDNESTKFDKTTDSSLTTETNQDFQNVTYSLIGQLNFNPENSLRIHFNSYTSNPSVNRLQNIYNGVGGYNINKGNPDLVPTYNNRLRLRYIHSNLERGSSLMFNVSATKTDNYLASHIYYQPEDFVVDGVDPSYTDDLDTYTTYANLDDYWYFYSGVNYGFPLSFIKCNLNVNAAVSYSIIPSIFGGEGVEADGTIIGGEENNTDKLSYRAGLTLGSNISENVDFTIKWWGSYNEATNSVNVNALGEAEKNKYFDHTASLAGKVVFGERFTFTTNLSYKQYVGFTDNYNDDFLLINAFLGYKVFKNRRGEVNVGINDALNQNTAFWRSVGNNYTQNIENLTIGRYVSMQFIYNLRLFGKGGSKDIKDYGSAGRLTGEGGKGGKGGKGDGGPRP